MATTTSPMEAARAATADVCRARTSSSAEKGSVQAANSAKKLRLTKVDAGFGPCANQPNSNQNCRAAHSEAMTAPPWMPHASQGRRSRDKVFRPSQSSSPKRNQRIASTPPR
jgi:hypothetical protein